jgi:hypothetical protein
MAIKLTDASVKALPTPTKGNHITYDDGDVGGFGVRVTAGGARSAAASTEQAYLETRQRAQRRTLRQRQSWQGLSRRGPSTNCCH